MAGKEHIIDAVTVPSIAHGTFRREVGRGKKLGVGLDLGPDEDREAEPKGMSVLLPKVGWEMRII